MRTDALVLAALTGVLILVLTGHPAPGPGFHIITDGGDAEAANNVGHFIESGYGHFDSRARFSPYQGKVYYVGPSPFGNPTVTLYEITTPEDMAFIESLARGALQATPGIK